MAIKTNQHDQSLARNRYYGATGLTTIPAFFANYVNFNGRSRRSEYWYISLWTCILTIICTIGLIFTFASSMTVLNATNASGLAGLFAGGAGLFLIAALIFAVAVFLPSLTLLVRRYRDAGVPWWVLLIQYGIVWIIAIIWGIHSTAYTGMGLINGIVILVITVMPSRPLK